jgi:AcrR family transcriptional regulator
MSGIPHPDVPAQVLPRGRHAAPRSVVSASQRERLLAAMAAAVAAKGYANVAVADVIERAGVSRKTFYEHFANKEDCFLAAYDAGIGALLESIDQAINAAAPDWLAATSAGTLTYLEALAANPDFARTFLVEVLAAGPAALERRAEVHQRFADQLAATIRAARRDLPGLPELPDYVFRACVGAINELVTEQLLSYGADTLPDLLTPILDVELAMLTGHELAAALTSAGAGQVAGSLRPPVG